MGRDPAIRIFEAALVQLVGEMERAQTPQEGALSTYLTTSCPLRDPRASKRATGGHFIDRCSHYTVLVLKVVKQNVKYDVYMHVRVCTSTSIYVVFMCICFCLCYACLCVCVCVCNFLCLSRDKDWRVGRL